MEQDRIIIPNAFTRGPTYHIVVVQDDGTTDYRIMTEYEFNQWIENGGDDEES